MEALIQDKGRRKSAATKHLRRTAWVRDHLGTALAGLGVKGAPDGWSVEPVIVTGGYSLAPLFRSSPVPVVHIDDLAAWVSGL